jgi:chemotaxis protein MotB
MPRKQQHEEHENHERWLVSYADFITLLFAFFVVMYAISSVNEGKYEVLSDSLENAFQEKPISSLNPIELAELARANQVDVTNPIGVPSSTAPIEPAAAGLVETQSRQEDVDVIQERLGKKLQPVIEAGLIDVREGEQGIEVEMKSSILFDSGSARLSQEALPVLEQFAAVLREFGNPLQVEGYTDNQPIATLIYPSNWELSAARAASVVNLFARLNVNPERMMAVGHAEQRARADNSTFEGRQQNRRVVVVIKTDKNALPIAGSLPLGTDQDLMSAFINPNRPRIAAPGMEKEEEVVR